MNNVFINLLMSRLEFPDAARETFLSLDKKMNQVQTDQLNSLVNQFMDEQISIDPILTELNSMSNEICISNYTLHFFFLLKCSGILYERYQENGLAENIYWDTIFDLKYKLIECQDVYGVWGTFVAKWYPGFLNMTRFALGRFQYEEVEFPHEQYIKDDIVVKKGDKVINMHIPSSGPMTKEIRMNSYKAAYEFFRSKLNGKPLAVVCDSWLLYPEHEKFLPQNSNILDFMHDFEIISFKESNTFQEAWRIFGENHDLPPEKLPANTSLQKAYAKRLINGEKTGSGYGILLFDGIKLI